MSPRFTDNEGRFHWGQIGYRARSAFAVILSLTVLVGGGLVVYNIINDAYIEWRTTEDFIGEGTTDVEVLIEQGMGITQIGDMLTEAGVVRSTKAFRDAVSEADAANKVQAGRFKLKKQVPAEKAVQMLLNPANQIRLQVTFPEGKTMTQQRDIIAASVGIKAEDVAEAEKDVTQYGLPGYANDKLEGFLFPSTYQVVEPPRASSIIKTQVDQFNKVASEINLEARAAELGRSPRDIVIVASILEKEVNKDDLLPQVSAVIYNRLKANEKLEMDSTVHYAIGQYDKVTTTAEDRKINSPYNTYRNPGLPAGPIGNPGKAALEAALTPADSKAKFFVTVNLETGETRFAETYEEHQKNVKLFQKYCETSDRC